MTDDEALALFVSASDVQPCETCRPMLMWATARGPQALAERIALLIHLARTELFEEVPTGRGELWSAVPPEQITAVAIMNGLRGYDVSDAVEIRCHGCSRQYRQNWVTERGYESWTVTWR